MRNKPYSFPVLLFLLAFAIRVAAVLALRDPSAAPSLSQMGRDAVTYNLFGTQVANGKGYSWESGDLTSFCAPGFPLFLSAIYVVAGQNYPSVYLALCLMGAASCVLTYAIARALVPERTAKVAGLLAVIYLPHVYFATEFATENVFVPCLAVAVWLMLRHLATGSKVGLFVAGLALGWGVLTRPFALLLLPLFAGVLLHHAWRCRRGWNAPFVLVVSCCLVVAPWTIRNYRVHHRVVAVATNGGVTFYGGNNDRVLREPAHWGGWIPSVVLPGRGEIEAAPDEVTRDQMQWGKGAQWVRGHAAWVPVLCVFKFVRMWLPEIDSTNRKYVLLQVATYTPFLVLFVVAAIYKFRRGRLSTGWALVHGSVLATVLVGLIFWGAPRFRDANAPLLMIYAAVGVEGLRSGISSLRASLPRDRGRVPVGKAG